MNLSCFYLMLFLLFSGCKEENKSTVESQSASTESPVNSEIIGKWKVTNSTLLPFEHISYCKSLELNSVFEFKSDRTLNVYESENGEICTKDQTFKVRGKKLVILEWDMLFEYEIQTLNKDTLALKIDRIPSFYWTSSKLNDEKVQKEIEEIQNVGILVTLTKI